MNQGPATYQPYHWAKPALEVTATNALCACVFLFLFVCLFVLCVCVRERERGGV